MNEVTIQDRKDELLMLPHGRLIQDPENPRSFYPKEDVQRMAQSIRKSGGVDQALIVTPLDGTGKYLVIDGNFRMVAAKSLGAGAPLLKCEVRLDIDRREKLLIMARTSALWFEKDPISEARHYRRLIDEERLTQAELARELGCSLSKITSRLKLLELDPEIQDLVAKGKLPKMPEVVDAFAQLEDRHARLKLASELARRRATVRSVVKACQKVNTELERRKVESRIESKRSNGALPGLAITASMLDGKLPSDEAKASPEGIRQAARQACQACDIKVDLLDHVPEPAWSLIKHAADETCDLCSLKDVRKACRGCPLPEFLVRMAKIAERAQEVERYERIA
jgi:ParB family chromosome partitioning protein